MSIDTKNYKYGVYLYKNKVTDKVVYIGKDSHILENRRHKQHLRDDKTNNKFNNHLRKNPHFYAYEVVCISDNIDTIESLELILINYFKSIGECELNIVEELSHPDN